MSLQNNKTFSDYLNLFIQFIKFGVVGLSNTILASAIYFILVYINVHYIIANTIAFVVSVINAFYWNNKYVFKGERTKTALLKAFVRTFAAYSITGLGLSNILLFVFVDIFGISKYIAVFLGLFVTVPLNFVLNKFWAFRSKKENPPAENPLDETPVVH